MSRPRIYVATSNPGKLRDFARVAGDRSEGWTLLALPGLAHIEPPPETGATFEENAREKAIYYARFAPGELVLADDSGLEVDALGGAPGVFSARYADRLGFPGAPGLSADERNNACLLAQLGRETKRTGRYRCALALARDGAVWATAEGAVEGTILEAPRGDGGFGYDPLFLVREAGQTMAELDGEARLRVGHRGRALRALFASLVTLPGATAGA